jgi:hypothetical protein
VGSAARARSVGLVTCIHEDVLLNGHCRGSFAGGKQLEDRFSQSESAFEL